MISLPEILSYAIIGTHAIISLDPTPEAVPEAVATERLDRAIDAEKRITRMFRHPERWMLVNMYPCAEPPEQYTAQS